MQATAGEAKLQRRTIMQTWTDRADVYIRPPRGSAQGRFSVLVKSRLKCNLVTINRQNAASMPEREALAAGRQLHWDSDYQLPDVAQFEIDGRRWNPLRDSITLRKLRPGDGPLYWMADVQRIP